MSGKQKCFRHSTPADARALACTALQRIHEGIPVQAALNTLVSEASLSGRDTALCSELVYGTLRTEIRLRHILGRVLPNPEKLPAEMQNMLLVAAYCILFLQKIPDYASVDLCVDLCRRRFGLALSRVANGALRSLIKLAPDTEALSFYMTVPSRGGKKAADRAERAALSLFYAVPQWITDLWCSAYGRERALSLLQRSFDKPAACLRVNPKKAEAAELRAALQASPDLLMSINGDGFAFASGRLPAELCGKSLDELTASGNINRQSAGSQWIMSRLGCCGWQKPVCDLCCGQGGKTTYLLERGVPVEFCADIHRPRLRRLAAECGRLGLAVPSAAVLDASMPSLRRWRGNILLDVPCSGLGTLARRPDIRKNRSYGDLAALTATQAALLERAWSLLERGCELAYVTCAVDPQENEKQAAAFLAAHADARLLCECMPPFEQPCIEGMYGFTVAKV